MRKWMSEMRKGFRQLCSAAFWRDFRAHYSGEAISKRLDEVAEGLRDATRKG